MPRAQVPVLSPAEISEIIHGPKRTHLLIVDIHADPFNVGGSPGAIFLANVETGAVVPLATDPNWVCPVNLTQLDGNVWLILDLCLGQVRRTVRRPRDQAGIVSSVVLFAGSLVAPISWLDNRDGTHFLVDGYADPLGLGVSTGAVFKIAGSPPTPQVFAAGPQLKAPSQIVRDQFGRHMVLDADANPFSHPTGGEGTIYCMDAAGNLTLAAAPKYTVSPLSMIPIPYDGTAFAGRTILIDANGSAIESPPTLTGKIFSLNLSDPWPVTESHELTDDPRLADPTYGLYERPNHILVADMNADPLGLGYDGIGLGYATFGRGAIYRFNLETGDLTVAVASPMFRNPTQMVWVDPQFGGFK